MRKSILIGMLMVAAVAGIVLGANGEMLDIVVGFLTVAEPIPTLSTLPLILLGLALLVVGLWVIRRRRAEQNL